jgi:hypothetical protein
MTQERYQEAAELLERRVKLMQGQVGLVPDDDSWDDDCREEAELCELAAEVLTKLASGWVLVPHPCRGIPDPACNYLAACGQVCNKCGTVHRQHLLAAAPKP